MGAMTACLKTRVSVLGECVQRKECGTWPSYQRHNSVVITPPPPSGRPFFSRTALSSSISVGWGNRPGPLLVHSLSTEPDRCVRGQCRRTILLESTPGGASGSTVPDRSGPSLDSSAAPWGFPPESATSQWGFTRAASLRVSILSQTIVPGIDQVESTSKLCG